MYINDKKIKGITCNSKKVNDGYIFVAIEGKEIDGNDFIDEAIDNGAIIIYTNKNISNKNIPIVKVNEPRKELAKLLNEFYEYPTRDLMIIGVTGTNGKTTTTHLIERLFKNAGYKTALIGTLGVKINEEYNKSILTTPDTETLYELFNEFKNIGVKVVVMEVSSHGLKFDRTYGVDFDAAIHTNVEVDHLDLHKSFEDYLNTKKILFDSLRRNRLAIINIDDENGTELLAGNKNVLTITYGLNSKSSVTASSINIQDNISFSVCIQRSIFTIGEKEYFPQEFNISTKLSGLYNVYNSLAAISCALYFGIDIDIIQDSFKEIEGVPRRFEKIYDDKFLVIDDFCHNPSGYQAVLDTVRSFNYNKLIIVNSIRSNRGVKINSKNALVLASWYNILNIPKVFLTLSEDVLSDKNKVSKEEIDEYVSIFKENNIIYEMHKSLRNSISKAIAIASEGDIILLLGPRGMNKGKEIFYDLIKDF